MAISDWPLAGDVAGKTFTSIATIVELAESDYRALPAALV